MLNIAYIQRTTRRGGPNLRGRMMCKNGDFASLPLLNGSIDFIGFNSVEIKIICLMGEKCFARCIDVKVEDVSTKSRSEFLLPERNEEAFWPSYFDISLCFGYKS